MKWIIFLAVIIFIGMNVKVKAIHSPKSLDRVVSEVAEKTVNKISDDTFSEIGENVKKNVNLNKLIEKE